ncbi:MAG: transglutaminase domain-containing protein [Promethearchaeota archaeon]
MSELREELLGGGINKKRVIGTVLVAVILISIFAFSTVFFNLLFGSQRPFPSKEKAKAEEEDPELIKPPFPFDEDFFQDLFDDLTPEQLQELMDMLPDMLDGNIDDLDLNDFSEALLALLGSLAAEKEIFRVYDYQLFIDMATKLWRYECFDEYTGESWHSTAASSVFDFISYGEYLSQYSSCDIITIKMPLTPNLGANSMVIPSFFPTPFIMDGSVYAENLDLGSVNLEKTDFNCTTIDLQFFQEDPVNLTYELFGLDLPSNNEINNSAVQAQYTPVFIKNKYLKLPFGIQNYINNYPNIKTHYDALDLIIGDTDNTFEVANKIRGYLQYNFLSPLTGMDIFSYNAAPEGRDIVDYFCEQGEGLWSDFATAFCVFARAFNVSSRFVDGFNSFGIEEGFDTQEGKDYFAIKYLNLYSWAEIYVPTDVSGNGNWVQIDVFEAIPYTPFTSEFNISVSADQLSYSRPDVANITAILTSTNSSVNGRTITFNDYTTGQLIGQSITDSNGEASILVNINNSQVVGPHIIEAAYGLSAVNYTLFTVLGPIEVNLNSVNPTEVNISDAILPDSTDIQGYVYDPISGLRVESAEVNFILFQKGTNIEVPTAFNPAARNTDLNGDFDGILNLEPSVSSGLYEIRVDFNGTWWIDTPYFNFPFTPIPLITDSSNRLEFNVTEALPLLFDFFINGTTPTDYENPKINRNDFLNLTAYLQIGPDPISDGALIDFYDVTQGNPIGSALTSSGYAQYVYQTDASTTAGPHLIYAKYGANYVYSYFILDEPISVNLDICPFPLQVNRSTSIGRNFLIHGYLNDISNGNPIKYGLISVFLLDSGIPVSKLILESGSYQLDETGEINLTFSVMEDTDPQNYTLRVDFNGQFGYPYFFNLGFMPNFVDSANGFYDLTVIDPYDINIDFYIDGNPTLPVYDDINLPERYNRGALINFTVNITQTGNPVSTGIVTLTDVFTDSLLGSHTFNLTDPGYYEFYPIDTTLWHAGLHQIRVDYVSGPITVIETTYVIINETMNIFTSLNKNSVLRGSVDSFTVSGTVQESGELLRGLLVNIILLNSTLSDFSAYLIGPSTWITNDVGYYQFVNSIDINCPQGEYYIRIDFNGTISYTDIFLNDFLIHNSSLLIPLNITAGTKITSLSYYLEYDPFPDSWADGDTLYVLGNLTWDNNNPITGVIINVTIIDETYDTIVIYNDVVLTDPYGGFNVSIFIDENDSWPTLKSNTEIRVSFDPIINGIYYAESDEESIFPS